MLVKLAEILKTDLLELVPSESILTYNNIHNIHKGDGIVYHKPDVEKIEDLYKRLLDAKDQQVESMRQLLAEKDKHINFLEQNSERRKS